MQDYRACLSLLRRRFPHTQRRHQVSRRGRMQREGGVRLTVPCIA